VCPQEEGCLGIQRAACLNGSGQAEHVVPWFLKKECVAGGSQELEEKRDSKGSHIHAELEQASKTGKGCLLPTKRGGWGGGGGGGGGGSQESGLRGLQHRPCRVTRYIWERHSGLRDGGGNRRSGEKQADDGVVEEDHLRTHMF